MRHCDIDPDIRLLENRRPHPYDQGVTFAAVTPMCLIAAEHGLPTMYGAIILAGLFTFLIAPFFSRFIRFFPPVVTGTIIMIIGITLLPVSIVWIGGGGDTHAATFAGPMNLFLAAITLAIVITLYRYGKGFISNISVLIGLIGGTIIATVLGQTNFDAVSRASWVNVVTPFTFGFPVFDVGSIISTIIVMFVTMVETTGDCIAIGEIVDKPIKKPIYLAVSVPMAFLHSSAVSLTVSLYGVRPERRPHRVDPCQEPLCRRRIRHHPHLFRSAS